MKKKTGKTINCKICDSEFYVPINRIKTAKFCSNKCKGKSSHTIQKSNCKICNNEFEYSHARIGVAKYCSRKCYYKAMHTKGSVIVNCKHCGKEINCSPSEKRVYCSKQCIGKESQKTFHPNYTTVRKKIINMGLMVKCQICGYSENRNILGVHHIDRNKHNNTLENLIVLCPNCHSLEHQKHIVH